MSEHPILFEYERSPYAQKIRLLLAAAGVSVRRCDQPAVLPRPDLEALGITYRRIPLLAIGKDVYCDSSLIIDTIMQHLAKAGAVPTSSADKAFQDWGNATFHAALGMIPSAALQDKAFVKDRASIFPKITRKDITELRPSALASFRARCKQVEDNFLPSMDGPFTHGKTVSLSEVHYMWSIRWGLMSLGAAKEAGFGKDAFPKLWKAIGSLPTATPEALSSDKTIEAIRGAGQPKMGPKGVMADDPLNLAAGTPISIESEDAEPGAHPQVGKLVGTGPDEVVVEVGKDGVRAHFPRVGYYFRRQETSKM
ncbi:hypothetical protein BAUCODRAFT_123025 [Baudoinia panamericana UAMH 10762]|uniref:Uncharacterized protein n=1 Tax=Baudoinia panamericana (strain UAMH 10762) TaxID=717646 RepID=M2MGG9_BAUPA|nr:uncharacterized protein BAUCODRAFT_123025 [Baudoinia panamericana UAMH 10762]EMC95726.1 hypothetical protein BAUCODRAFT_123025 [Baudoinia panamericana UAMH 10762]